jgi:hypothetical protein
MTFLPLARKAEAATASFIVQQLGCKLGVSRTAETMKNNYFNHYALVLVALLALLTSAVATPATPVAVRDASGKWHRPLEAKGTRASVLLFVAHDCPISNSYAPEINRLHAQFAKQNIGFYVVYADSKMTADKSSQTRARLRLQEHSPARHQTRARQSNRRDGHAGSGCGAAGW